MSATLFQLPEIIYEILEYVSSCAYGQHNLYTCLFVNRQFHACATRLLFRKLYFWAKPSENTLDFEKRIGIQFCQRPDLALHVHELHLDVTVTRHTLETPQKPFETRIEPILQSCRNLRRIELETRTWKKSQPWLIAVLNILNGIENRPSLSLSFNDVQPEDRLEDDEIYERADPVLRIKDKLPVKSLYISTRWSPIKLRFLSQFRQLETLTLSGHFATTEGFGWEDLETVFKGVPLSKLIVYCPNIIHTFPSSLKSLCLDEDLYGRCPLNYITWRAICRLKGLTELELDYSTVDEWDDPCEFLSDLRSFSASISCDTAFVQQVLQPIFSRSSRLASLKFDVVGTHLSSELMRCLATASHALCRLNVNVYRGAPYCFRDLADGYKISPNLTRLTLPWPALLGEEITPTETQRRFYAKCRNGIPERLTFQNCKCLAASFPRLDKIEFVIRKENMATTFSRYWLRRSHMPTVPLQSEKIGDWWTTYLERLQSIKMAKFIDASSPCLNICSILFHFEDPDCRKETATHRFSEDIVIFLSLDQVRKHSGR